MHQSRRPSGLTPLAIILPHPPLPHRRSSLLSVNSASASAPHTPRSCPSPSLPLYYPANRKSTDSWTSSNANDDIECDWRPEHVVLLSRTLDALPAHLVTPFNGPIPPSNLLDKIARGVSQAKGPADWPHSIRATRAKLIELSRGKAKEDALAEQRRRVIKEEVEIDDGSHYSYFHEGEHKPLGGVGIGARRPLYRQSSMDFIKPSPDEIKDNTNIAKLSNRLQRTDRSFPNPAYHPYSRIPRPPTNRRSSSPPLPTDLPPLINPSSTPSSSTLNSFSSSSFSSQPRVLRRTASTLSSGSMSIFSNSSGGMPLPDPRIQRVRRSDSFCAGLPPPALPPKDVGPSASTAGIKRAPSYGALAQEAKAKQVHAAAAVAGAGHNAHVRKHSGSYPSSDEEEKIRAKHAKKMRTKTGAAGIAPAPSSPPGASPPSSAPPSPGNCTTAPPSPIVLRRPTASVPVSVKEKSTSISTPKPKSGVEGVKSPKSPYAKPIKPTSKVEGHGSKTGKKDKEMRPAMPMHMPMNLQRNPSMFGAELPHLVNSAHSASAAAAAGVRSPPPRGASVVRSPPPPPTARAMAMVVSPPAAVGKERKESAPQTQSPSPKVKTLRRVRRLAPARRISFGSLVPGDEADADGEGDGEDQRMGEGRGERERERMGTGLKGCLQLGSAFQLL
ncbi:hypothetical protein B0H34DRAFT_678454 [Crassisporium funariophilum]|nr:hypothetical protein B0H34DRAFT_678454 [Crassisporium funariophilum]